MNFLRRKKNFTVVIEGTGKTGRGGVKRLKAKRHKVRAGARSAIPSLDWDNEKGWDAPLKDVTSVYTTYAPDLAMPSAPKDVVWLLDNHFSAVLDERNAYLCDGVQRAFGRPPKDLADYARKVAATGAWNTAA